MKVCIETVALERELELQIRRLVNIDRGELVAGFRQTQTSEPSRHDIEKVDPDRVEFFSVHMREHRSKDSGQNENARSGLTGAAGCAGGELTQFGVLRFAKVSFERARVFAGNERAFDFGAGEPVIASIASDA
jgi:hypothetical protein